MAAHRIRVTEHRRGGGCTGTWRGQSPKEEGMKEQAQADRGMEENVGPMCQIDLKQVAQTLFRPDTPLELT